MSLKKIFTTLIAIIFTWTAAGSEFARALSLNPAQVAADAATPEIYDGVFKNFARLTSSADFGGDTAVINIQDLHMEPSVQKNISSIIEILVKDYGVENVYVEGGYGKISADWLSKAQNADMRKSIAGSLLNSALITGTEYYCAVNGKKDFLIGLEDENIHKQNIKRLGTILERKPFYEKSIASLRNELEFFQLKYFSHENRRLAKLIDKHKKGYVSSEKYYSILLNYLKRNSAQSSGYYGTVMPLDMKDYPDICLFLYVSKIGKKLNQKTVNRDLGTIVGNIKETVSYSEYKTLLDQTGGFKDIDPLFDFIKRKNISNIPASVSDFMEFNDKSKAVNPVKLITEERLLIENIRVALSKNRNELEVSFLSDMLSYFEDYLKTSISADDSAYLKSRFGKFQSLWEKYSPYNKTMTDLKEDIGLLNEYYAVNDERNEIFLKNINVKTNVAPSADKPKAVYNETVAKLVSGKKNVIVCVTGGYHSKGLTDLLAAGGISYAVLTPMVSGGVEKALKKYEETARAEAQMFSSTLQLSLFSQILSYALAKNDDASRKMAAKFFVSAAEALKDYSFGESNIKELTGYLNEMSGGYYKFDYDAQSGMVKMISKDGTLSEDFIKLSENKDGKILIENRYSPKIEDKIILKDYGRLLSAEEMSKFMSNFKKMLGISTLNYGFDFFAPKIYGFSEHIANWAAEHNIYIDIDAINGLSFDLAEKYGFTNLIDENPALARQSEARQNAAVRKYLRELDYKNDNMGNTEKLIFAADLLNEFLPITHDTMMMYAAYEETSAAKILDEVQSLRIGKRLDYTQFKDSQMPGTAGIRGEIGDITTVSMLQIIAQAQANLALKEAAQKGVPASEIKVVIGGDTRYGGNEFQQAVAGVFAANGFNVEIFDSNIPTPLISFYTKDGKTLGANITASHNKGKDNGYKFTIGGAQANDGYKKELIDEMKKIVEAEKNGEQAVKYATPFSEEGKKRIKIISASAESEKYTEALVDFFAGFFGKTKEEFKDTIKEKQKDAPYLIFEANNGAAPVLLDNVLSALGIDLKNTEVRHWWRDIGYGAATDTDRGAPEPNEANLNNLKTRMSEVMKANEQKTVIGAATDVDADRIGTLFYSDNGQIRPLTPNDIAMIMLYVSLTKKDFVSAPKDLLVRTSPSTHALDYLAAAFGVKTASVNVGSKYIAEHINNPAENVLLGMESSGTILFKEWIKDKEGIMANMLMYLIPLMTDKSYGQLLSEIYGKVGYTPYFSEAKADIKTNEEKTNAVSFFENVTMEEMKRLIKDGFIDLSKLGKNPRLVTLKKSDGLYLGFATDKTDAIAAGKNIDEGGEIIWVQMRASGTENAVRVYAESNEKNITEQLVEIGKKITAQGYDKLKSLRGNRDIKFDEKGKKIETVALKKGNDVLEIRAENEYVVSLSFDGEIVPIEEFNAAIPEGYFAQVPANNSLWRVEKSDENSITLVLSKGVGEWENIWVRNTVTLSDGGIKSEVEIANPKEWYGDAYDKSYIVNYLRQDHPDEVIIFAGDQTQEGGNDYPLKKALLSDQEKTGRLSETIQVSGPDEIIAKLEEAMVKYPGKKFVFAFDLDGTLTKPREHMSAEFAKQFGRWIADKTVYIATGANLEVFKGQTPFDNVLQNLTGVYGSMGNEFYKNEKVEGTDRNEFRQVRVHTIEIDKTDPDLETEFNRYLKEFEENKEEVGYTGELGQGHIDDYRNGRNSINFCVAKPPTSSQSRKLFQDWLEKQDAADGYFSRTSMVKLLSEKFRKFVTAKGGSTSMDIVDREIIEANPVEVKIQGKSETLKTGKTLKFTFEFKKDSALDSFKTAAAASNSSIVQSAPIATLGAVLLTAQMHYALLIIAGIFAVYYAFALFKNPGLVVKNTFEMVILYPVRTILSVLLFPVGLLARLLWIKYEGVKFGLFAEEDKENLALLVQKMHAFMPDVINTLASYSERILSLTDRILRKQIRTKPDLQEKKLLREQIEEAKKMYAAEKEKAEQIIKDNEFGFLLEDSEIVFESGEYRLNYIEFGYADFEDRKSFLNIAEREFTGLGILSNDGGRFEFNQKQDVSDSYIKTLKRGDSDLNLEMVNASLENIRKIGKILAMMEYEKKSKQPQDAKKKYADAISELKTAAKKLNIDMAEPGKNDELFYYFESPSAVQKQKLLNSGKFKLYQTDITEYLCLYSVENNHYIMIPNLDEISSYIGFFAQLAPVDDFEYLQNSINEYEAAADNEKAGALIDLADEIFNNAYYSEHHRLLERRRLIDLIIKAVELLEINAKEYSRGHAKYENLLAISRHAERSLFDNNSFNAALKRLNNAMKPFGIKYYKGPSDWIFSFDTPSDEEALKKIVENEKRIDRKIRWESGYGRINSLIRLHDDTFLTEEEIHTLANLFEKTEHPAQSGGLEKFLSFALPVIALLGMGYLMATGEGNTEAFSLAGTGSLSLLAGLAVPGKKVNNNAWWRLAAIKKFNGGIGSELGLTYYDSYARAGGAPAISYPETYSYSASALNGERLLGKIENQYDWFKKLVKDKIAGPNFWKLTRPLTAGELNAIARLADEAKEEMRKQAPVVIAYYEKAAQLETAAKDFANKVWGKDYRGSIRFDKSSAVLSFRSEDGNDERYMKQLEDIINKNVELKGALAVERKAFGAGTTTDFQFTAIPVRANDVQKVIDMFKKAARRKPNVKYMAEDSGSFTIKKAGETPADVSENLKAAIKEYMSNPDNEKAAALIGLANDALDGRFSDSKIDDLVIEIFDLVTVSSKEYIDKLELNSAIERQYYRLSIFSDRIRHSLYDDKEYQRAIDRLDEAMRPFGIGYSARIGNSFFQFSSGEGRAVLEKIIGTAEDIKVKMDPNIIPVDIWRNPKYNYNRYGTGKQFDRGGQMFLYKHAFLNIKQLDALTELFKAEAAPKSAIMTKNYPRVYAWLASGDSVLKTLIKLAFAELIPSMNTDAFVAGHPLQNRDAAENLSIVTMLSFVAGFLFFTAAFLSGGLGMFLLASAVSSAIAVIPAAAYHIFLDYKTVKKMSEEVSGFAGNQEIKNTQEAQNLEVIILGELPENPEKYGFRNAGLTVDGEIIWISKKTGRLVIFSNSKDTAKIADEMNGMIPKITGKKSAAFEISALIVEDRGNNEMRFEYAYDIPVVSKTYYDMIAKLSGGDLIVAGERMRKEAKAEKDAAARNFVMDLSFIKSNEDLLKAVNAYNKSGNQQIALPVEFFQGKSDGEIKKLVSAMSGNGTRVFAVIGKESALNDHDKNNLQKALINYGFAGYALKDGVETVFRDYTSDKNSKARKISGFNTEEQLISEIEKTGYDTVKLIDVANYIKIIENNRDIAARIESLVGLFGSKILTLFDFGSNITADYAVNKVLDTDIGIIPSFSTTYQETDINNFFAIFEKYIQGLKLSEAEQTFIDLQTDKIYAVPEFAVFLQRINKNADQSAGADAVKKAFIATIFKKMKVKYDTDGAGLQDRELERLMTNTALSGIAAVKNEINEFRQDIMRDAVMQAFPNENMSNFAMFDGKTYSPEDIINGSARYEVNGKEIIITADIVYSAAEIRSKELSLRSSAYAATAYELLLLYAERRRSDNAADNSSMKIDPNAVATILTQA